MLLINPANILPEKYQKHGKAVVKHLLSNFYIPRNIAMQQSNIINIMVIAILIFLAQGCGAGQLSDNKASMSDPRISGDSSLVEEVKTSDGSWKENTMKGVPHSDSNAALFEKWSGVYEPAVSSVTEKIRIYESGFSFGEKCQGAAISFIKISETDLVFEVDPKSDCGFSGWIVALSAGRPGSKVILFKAYRNIEDFHSAEYKMSITYLKSQK